MYVLLDSMKTSSAYLTGLPEFLAILGLREEAVA